MLSIKINYSLFKGLFINTFACWIFCVPNCDIVTKNEKSNKIIKFEKSLVVDWEYRSCVTWTHAGLRNEHDISIIIPLIRNNETVNYTHYYAQTPQNITVVVTQSLICPVASRLRIRIFVDTHTHAQISKYVCRLVEFLRNTGMRRFFFFFFFHPGQCNSPNEKSSLSICVSSSASLSPSSRNKSEFFVARDGRFVTHDYSSFFFFSRNLITFTVAGRISLCATSVYN